jgi:hypothetical protein
VALLQQQPAGHQPDAVTGPRYQNSRHHETLQAVGPSPTVETIDGTPAPRTAALTFYFP